MNEDLLDLLKEELPTHFAECVEILVASNILTLEKLISLSPNSINNLGFKPKARSLIKSFVAKKLSGIHFLLDHIGKFS
jgi:hypothetical protein